MLVAGRESGPAMELVPKLQIVEPLAPHRLPRRLEQRLRDGFIVGQEPARWREQRPPERAALEEEREHAAHAALVARDPIPCGAAVRALGQALPAREQAEVRARLARHVGVPSGRVPLLERPNGEHESSSRAAGSGCAHSAPLPAATRAGGFQARAGTGVRSTNARCHSSRVSRVHSSRDRSRRPSRCSSM